MRELIHYFKTVGRLIAWLIRRTAGRFLLAAVANAGARILQLITFFLPLKVLIMLSSAGALGGMQAFPAGLFADHLFMLAVPAVYLGYLILGSLARRFADNDLCAQERLPFAEQGACVTTAKELKKIHAPCTQIASEALLIGAIMLFSAALHPALFLSFLLTLGVSLALHCKYTFRIEHDQRMTRLRLDRYQLVEYVAATGFMLIFFLLAGAWSDLGLDVFSGILLLLAGRMCCQALQRIATATLRLPSIHYRCQESDALV